MPGQPGDDGQTLRPRRAVDDGQPVRGHVDQAAPVAFDAGRPDLRDDGGEPGQRPIHRPGVGHGLRRRLRHDDGAETGATGQLADDLAAVHPQAQIPAERPRPRQPVRQAVQVVQGDPSGDGRVEPGADHEPAAGTLPGPEPERPDRRGEQRFEGLGLQLGQAHRHDRNLQSRSRGQVRGPDARGDGHGVRVDPASCRVYADDAARRVQDARRLDPVRDAHSGALRPAHVELSGLIRLALGVHRAPHRADEGPGRTGSSAAA